MNKEELENIIKQCGRIASWGAEIAVLLPNEARIRTVSPRSTYLLALALKNRGFQARVESRNSVRVRW